MKIRQNTPFFLGIDFKESRVHNILRPNLKWPFKESQGLKWSFKEFTQGAENLENQDVVKSTNKEFFRVGENWGNQDVVKNRNKELR